MLLKMGSFKDSVDLLKIKTDNLLERQQCGYLLKDDIWGNGTLLLKSGTYLTEDIINKLLKFGVKKVNVDVDNVVTDEIKFKNSNNLIEQFIKNQNVLIIEKNSVNSAAFIKKLVESGFDSKNIYLTKITNTINTYFKYKQINFLFIEQDLYENCKKCVEKYSLLRNTYAFIITNNNFATNKKNERAKIQFISSPVVDNSLNSAISDALNHNFLDFTNEEEFLIS